MTFKEYREEGWFLKDVNANAYQEITAEKLHKYRCVPYYTNLNQGLAVLEPIPGVDEQERFILFSISVYFTSLLLQSVGKLYGRLYLDLCCRSCHWPFFCVSYGNVVSPIEVLYYGDLKPGEDVVESYIERLEEATDFFVEDFVMFLSPGASSPEPDAHKNLIKMVDVPILRKELDNELGFFKKWLRNQTANYGSRYMDLDRRGYPNARSMIFKESPEYKFPEGKYFGVQDQVTLHSVRFRQQLQGLILFVGGVTFKQFCDEPQGAPSRDLIRRVLAGEWTTVDYNMVAFRTPRGMVADEAALELLREPLVTATYILRDDFISENGRIRYRVNPESLQVEILRGENENLYDVICVRFEGSILVENPLPLLSLEELKVPFAVHSIGPISEFRTMRALLEYGNRISLERDGKSDGDLFIIKVPENPEEMENGFFYESFMQKPFTPRQMMRMLSWVGLIPELTKVSVSDTAGTVLHWDKCTVQWDRVLSDLIHMEEAVQNAIAQRMSPRKVYGFHDRVLKTHNGRFVVNMGSQYSSDDIMESLESWVDTLRKTRQILQEEVIPLAETLPPRKSMVAWTFCNYIFRKIQTNPLDYVESSFPLIQKYALLLVG
ncbi:hypothetical protein [Fibrobacter sp. UWEL]|uniref:hypothetical protein n=1 Tax=Fibrobacter sp. UWEL TaxID=1896209 RepID=UPI00091A280E|nr:hypothetical protein [Fibrobacter sp. UWEL]SHL54602.1 hypothetical protein SAMN05720468_1452 [Fibrobacter sp. UWEL]